MRIQRFSEGEEVPDGATFLCVHAVPERAWIDVTGTFEGAWQVAPDGVRTATETRKSGTVQTPYAWFLVP